MFETNVFKNIKTPQDFMREEQEFEFRKRQRALQEQMQQVQMQKAQQELNAPKMPYQGTGLEPQLINQKYMANIQAGMDEQQALQNATDTVLQSQVSIDPKTGYQVRRGAIFDSSPSQINQMPPSQVMGSPMSTGTFMPPQAQSGGVPAMPAGQLDEQLLAEAQDLPELQFNPTDYDVTSPYGREELNVFAAKEGIKSQIEQAKEQRDIGREKQAALVENERAYGAFSAAMQNVESSMSNTATNPILGQLPALTAEAQIAEGATSTLAPILKQLFRSAGEGTFTDNDQKMLMNMVPTRVDLPQSRQQKIKMIDQVVRAKLGMGQVVNQEPAGSIDSLLNKYAPR